MIAATLSLAPVFMSCMQEMDTRVIVENDFRGAILLISHSPDGVELPVDDGKHIVKIPPSGVLKLPGSDPTTCPTVDCPGVTTAAFSSGRALPMGIEFLESENYNPRRPALWYLFTAHTPQREGEAASIKVTEGDSWMYVGPYWEYQIAVTLDPSTLAPGHPVKVADLEGRLPPEEIARFLEEHPEAQ